MDAVQISDTCVKLKNQGMPEHLAVIHAITYALGLAQTDYDKRYILAGDLPSLIEKEVQRILKRWVKWVLTPIGIICAALWWLISNWDNVVKFLRALLDK